MRSFRLATCSLGARVLFTGFVLTTGLGLFVAVLEIHAMLGGLTPQAVAATVRGTEAEAGMAEFAEEFGEEFATESGGALSFGRSFKDMVQTSHTHTLAMPLLLLGLGGVFLGADMSDRFKAGLYAVAFVALVGDLGGLWLLRYVSAGFAYVNAASGFVYCTCAGIMILRSLWDMWMPGRPVASGEGGA